MMIGRTIVALVAAILASVGFVPAAARACAVCLTGAEDPTIEAINASVLFMMAAPYAVVAAIAAGIFFTCRRAAGRRGNGAVEQPESASTWNSKETRS